MHAFVMCLFAMVGLASSVARADPSSHSLSEGYQLLEACNSSSTLLRSMCFGYVAAVTDDAKHDHQVGQEGSCLPQFTNLDLFRITIVHHFEEHPEGLNEPSFQEAKHALALAFPCH